MDDPCYQQKHKSTNLYKYKYKYKKEGFSTAIIQQLDGSTLATKTNQVSCADQCLNMIELDVHIIFVHHCQKFYGIWYVEVLLRYFSWKFSNVADRSIYLLSDFLRGATKTFNQPSSMLQLSTRCINIPDHWNLFNVDLYRFTQIDLRVDLLCGASKTFNQPSITLQLSSRCFNIADHHSNIDCACCINISWKY